MIKPSRQFAQPMTGHAVPNNTVDASLSDIAQNIEGTPIQTQPVIPNPVDPAAQAVDDAIDLNNTIT